MEPSPGFRRCLRIACPARPPVFFSALLACGLALQIRPAGAGLEVGGPPLPVTRFEATAPPAGPTRRPHRASVRPAGGLELVSPDPNMEVPGAALEIRIRAPGGSGSFRSTGPT